MQLTDIQRLNSDYSQQDVNDIVAVIQSTFLTTPSSVLRWGNVKEADAKAWMRNVINQGFPQELSLERISSLADRTTLPSTPLAEHLIVRDLDLTQLDRTTPNTPTPDSTPGRIVAHADYRYLPSYGASTTTNDPLNSKEDTTTIFPPGFNKPLHLLINHKVESTLEHLFHALPCFELHGISTLTPSHLRKGIAKHLVAWIYQFADRLSLPVILAGSPLGLPLYRKCGFEEYRQFDMVVDLAEFGGEGIHRHVLMVRWPEREEGMVEEWRAWRRKNSASKVDGENLG